MSDIAPILARDEAHYLESGRGSEATLGLTDVMRTVRCTIHARYKGLRRPRVGCQECQKLYDYKRSIGVREKRKKEPKE